MSAILGFTAAASVELYRLVVHDTRSICAEDRGEAADRNWRAQLRAANRHGVAIAMVWEELAAVGNSQLTISWG